MTHDPDHLGDARSRAENARFREMAQRQQASNPEYAYAPRWAPMGNWRMSGFDLFIVLLGVALILMVLGMRLLGVIGQSGSVAAPISNFKLRHYHFKLRHYPAPVRPRADNFQSNDS